MTLEELTALENEWLAKQPWHGYAEQRDELYKRIGMYEAWQGIFREYVTLAREGNLEALKRAMFLCWYNVSEPGWLTGLMILDSELIGEVYGLVDDLACNGRLDAEFTWMLPYYYLIADFYLRPEFGAVVKASRQNRDLWRQACLESSFDGRGQLGEYWASIQANLKNRRDTQR